MINRIQSYCPEQTTRNKLALNQYERLRAIVSYSQKTVRACQDLRNTLSMLNNDEISEDLRVAGEETLDYLEHMIRNEFIRTFGHDMIQD